MKSVSMLMTAIAVITLALASPAAAKGKDCPPGLAKKHNGCMPPGQAKKRHSGDHDHYGDEGYYDFSRYQRVGEYILIPREDWDRFGLNDPRDGTGYAIRDNEILRVALDTLRVIEAIRTLADVLN